MDDWIQKVKLRCMQVGSLCQGFTAQLTQLGHVEHSWFT